MYYSWGQWPYGVTPFYRSLPSNDYLSNDQGVENLNQRMEELQREWQEIRDKVLEWEARANLEPTRNQVTTEIEGLELLRGLQEQITSLRSEQITAYEQLLNKFLTNQMSDRIREIQKDITPGKIVEQFSAESN